MTFPEEDSEEGACAVVEGTMYGTRGAPHAWRGDYTELLEEKGFRSGWHQQPGCLLVGLLGHGDDFVVLGDEAGLRHMESVPGE